MTERDPITLHGEWLMANGVADRAALDAIQEELDRGDGRGGGVRASTRPYPDPEQV